MNFVTCAFLGTDLDNSSSARRVSGWYHDKVSHDKLGCSENVIPLSSLIDHDGVYYRIITTHKLHATCTLATSISSYYRSHIYMAHLVFDSIYDSTIAWSSRSPDMTFYASVPGGMKGL
jgi:hypothetical protein